MVEFSLKTILQMYLAFKMVRYDHVQIEEHSPSFSTHFNPEQVLCISTADGKVGIVSFVLFII